MKIYTRTGDDGTTGLLGGRRVHKSDMRVECSGAIDELNAALGVAVCAAPAEMLEPLRQVQNDLFAVGAYVAMAAGDAASQILPPLDDSLVARLEGQIDSDEALLPPLRQFILPGGSESAGRLHLARTICRRAERNVVALATEHLVAPIVITYLNRLGDWLFVMARRANQLAGVTDVPWEK